MNRKIFRNNENKRERDYIRCPGTMAGNKTGNSSDAYFSTMKLVLSAVWISHAREAEAGRRLTEYAAFQKFLRKGGLLRTRKSAGSASLKKLECVIYY